MFVLNNNLINPIRYKVSYKNTRNDQIIVPMFTLEEATRLVEELDKQFINPHEYLSGPFAPQTETLVFGYGYGEGTIREHVRPHDGYDEFYRLIPWSSGEAVEFKEVIYHNKWKTVSYIINYKENFRLYLKYACDTPNACVYIKNIHIEGIKNTPSPDEETTIVEKDGENVYRLPNNWSKLFLLSDDEAYSMPDGQYIVTFDYFVEDPLNSTDLPDEPLKVYNDIQIIEEDVSDCTWMEGLKFENYTAAQKAYEMGEAAYKASLPDDPKALTDQITALQLALVELYEGGLL